MRTCKLFLVVAAMVAQAATVNAQMTPGIAWQTDLDAARAMAEKQQKLLLIHFYNENCPPCAMLEARVFNQPNVAGAVHSHYIPVKLNTNDFPATAERFGIVRIPTDVVITPQGQVINRLTSPATPMAYIQHMTTIATEHQTKLARDFATAPADDGTSKSVNPAYSNLGVAADNNSFTAPAADAGMTTTPYAQPGAATPPAAGKPEQPAVAATQPPAGNPVATNPNSVAVNPVAVTNPYADQPVTPIQPEQPVTPAAVAPATPTAQIASVQPVTPPAAAPQLPQNSPPLGFFGYCPVSMKEDMEAAKKENRNCSWQKGDVRWGCYHRDRTYLFASAEKRDRFLADPDSYTPALSGADPVLAIDSNQDVPGRREYGIEYHGKFYMFSSEDNLRKFFNQPQRYADGVRQAMNAPEGRLLR